MPSRQPAPLDGAAHAVVTEWDVGTVGSMQHDLAVHPDGHVYAVDRATAEAVAIEEFKLDDQERKRLVIEEVRYLTPSISLDAVLQVYLVRVGANSRHWAGIPECPRRARSGPRHHY